MQPWHSTSLLAPGLIFPVQPRFRHFAWPPWILIAEAAEPRDHGLPAFLKRAKLTIFGNVAAKIADRTPGSFGSLRQACISEVDAGHYASHKSNSQHIQLIDFPAIQQWLIAKSGLNHDELVARGARAAWAPVLPTAGSGYKSRDCRPTHAAGMLRTNNTDSLHRPRPCQPQ